MMTSSGRMFTIVVLLVTGTEADFTASVTAGLIAAIERKYASGCVVLFTSSEMGNLSQQEGLMHMQLRKLLSRERIQVTASCIQALNSTSSLCTGNVPLNVILSSDLQVRTKLEEYSKTNSLAGATWLLFLSTGSISSYFADIYVPFDCEFLVIQPGQISMLIYEVYYVAKGKPLNEKYYGRWNFITGLTSENCKLLKRRGNLDGIVLKAITASDPPIMKLKPFTNEVSGFLGRVWRILEKKMNFRTNFTITKDMTKGQKLNKGDCSGMIGKVQCGEVDVALGAFSTGSYPGVPIKFTMPLIYTAYQVYIKKLKGRTTEWDAFLTPFSPRLWLVLVITIMFMSLYLATFYSIGRRIGNEEAGGPEVYTLYDSFLYIFGAFCQQGHDITPKSTPCRLIYITAYLTALVLLAAYSAALISSLTVYHTNLPFTDLDGILKYRRFKMGVVDKSEMYYTFSDEEEDGIFGDVYRKLMEPDPANFPSTSLEGLKRVCSMDYAFLAIPESVMPLLSLVNCTIVPLPYKTYPISLAVAFTPDNPYREFISYRLRMLRDGGILQRLRIKNWTPLSETATKGSLVSVDLSAVAPLLMLLTSSVLVSVIVLIAEHGKVALSRKESRSSLMRSRTRIEKTALRFNKSPSNNLNAKNNYILFPWKLLPQNMPSSSFQDWHE